MAINISITIPDNAAVDAQAALSAQVGLPSTGPNAKLGLIDHVKKVTTNWRVKQAADSASSTAAATAATDLSGIT